MKYRYLCLVISGVLLAVGCENIDFKKAQKTNTIDSYTNYLEKYPKGKFIQEAKTAVDGIEFGMVRQKNAIEDYKEFIATHPGNTYIPDASKELSLLVAAKYGYSIPRVEGDYIVAEYESPIRYPDIGGMMWGMNGDTITYLFGSENWRVTNQEGYLARIATAKINGKEKVSFRLFSAKEQPLNLAVQFEISGNLKTKQKSFQEYLLNGNVAAGKRFHELIAESLINAKNDSK